MWFFWKKAVYNPYPLQFSQVNVFSADALAGNPLAVVHAPEGLSEAQMAATSATATVSIF